MLEARRKPKLYVQNWIHEGLPELAFWRIWMN
jgi:hypothetical protein